MSSYSPYSTHVSEVGSARQSLIEIIERLGCAVGLPYSCVSIKEHFVVPFHGAAKKSTVPLAVLIAFGKIRPADVDVAE